MDKDELAARRWFCRRLAEVGEQYPQLRAPEQQRRLAHHLMDEGEQPCHDGQQANRPADQRGADA